jgi:hypothetical protein
MGTDCIIAGKNQPGLQGVQDVAVHPEQLEFDEDLNFPPTEKPHIDIIFLTPLVWHWGHSIDSFSLSTSFSKQ